MNKFVAILKTLFTRSHPEQRTGGDDCTHSEIQPPWVKYPGFLPGDPFWRQGGELWFHDVWRPYYDSLSPGDQKAYLERWSVPEEWDKFYFDTTFQHWLESIDHEE